MKKLLITLLLVAGGVAGCSGHNHALDITSNPTCQKFEVYAEDRHGEKVNSLNLTTTSPYFVAVDDEAKVNSRTVAWIATNTLVTPYQVVFPGEVYRATVVLHFSDGSHQIKTVAFTHQQNAEQYYESVVGFPLVSKKTDIPLDRKVHFDSAALLKRVLAQMAVDSR